jgi:hypothetical protein
MSFIKITNSSTPSKTTTSFLPPRQRRKEIIISIPIIISTLLLLFTAAAATIPVLEIIQYAHASHAFEAGVEGNAIPDNTHVRLDGLKLEETAVLPLYDASPNFVSGHFLLRAPCDENNVPIVTAIAGHVDEHEHETHVDKIPLFFIGHASTAGSCIWHSHIPDPLNGGSPRITDIDLINLSGEDIKFNSGDAVDISVQRTLGDISQNPYEEDDVLLPSDLKHGNPVFDLNDDNPDNDGLGVETGVNEDATGATGTAAGTAPVGAIPSASDEE